MKWLDTYRRGKQLEADEISSRRGWMDAIARNATRDALHIVIASRSLEWWKEAIKQAEAKGNKYVALAELLLDIEKGDV